MSLQRRAGLPLLLIAVLALIATGRAADRATTIVGADLADGSGAPLRRANVRFVNDRIVARRRREAAGAATKWSTAGASSSRRASSTSTITRRPGWPTIRPPRRRSRRASPPSWSGPTAIRPGRSATTCRSGGARPSAVNVASFVGHATVRRQVMKDDFKRAARADEIARMALLVDQGMREGAAGLSSGLEYEVGGYAETSELIELAKVVARYGGVYMSHIRDEADKSFDALKEAIAIGEGAHVAVQISHIKLGTVGVWRKAAEAIALIEAARAARRRRDRRRVSLQRVAARRSPCWCPNKRYDDPPSVEKALADVGGAAERADRPPCGASGLRVPHAGRDCRPSSTGRRSSSSSRSSRTAAPTVVCTSMVDEDIRAFYTRPWVMVGSDGGIANRHPRGAGTFPRVLGRYVRDQRWLTLPEAIRKMTSAPAARLRLEGRGRIAGRRDRGRRAVQPEDDRRSLDVHRSRRAADRRRESVRRRRSSRGTTGKPTRRAPGQGADVRPHAGRQRCRRLSRCVPDWGTLPAGPSVRRSARHDDRCRRPGLRVHARRAADHRVRRRRARC